MKKEMYHCSGCKGLIDCENALKDGSETCDLYVRNDYFNCHKCLNFGKECQKSGLIECHFLPRVSTELFGRKI